MRRSVQFLPEVQSRMSSIFLRTARLVRLTALPPPLAEYIAVAVIAPVVSLDLVWTAADTLNALMAIPNLVAVLLLSGVVVKETKKYINNLDAKDTDEVPLLDKDT